MKKIDDNLGGNSVRYYFKISKKVNIKNTEDDDIDDWEDEDSNEEKAKYWFTRDKIDRISVHEYLESYLK